MAVYPADLIQEHRLLDGRTVTIRPIRPDDRDREKDFLTALSGERGICAFNDGWPHPPTT